MKTAWTILLAGLIVGTAGYIADFTGQGTLIPPSGSGWLEIIGFLLVIPTAIYLKARGAR